MQPSRFRRNRRAIYEILGMFFLIIILVVITVGLNTYYEGVLTAKKKVSDQLGKFNTASIVRDKLLSCFGDVLQPSLIQQATCASNSPLDYEILSQLARGYDIEQIPRGVCSEKKWYWTSSSQEQKNPEEFVYFVPIQNEETGQVCLGRMTVRV